MTTAIRRYTLKAVNDDTTECEICGKVELKRVMWIAELNEDGEEIGEPFACGTTCGAALLKQTVAKVRTRVNNFESEASRVREGLYLSHPSWKKAREVLDELNIIARGRNGSPRLTFKERQAHPLYKKFKALDGEAREFSNAQDVAIELKF